MGRFPPSRRVQTVLGGVGGGGRRQSGSPQRKFSPPRSSLTLLGPLTSYPTMGTSPFTHPSVLAGCKSISRVEGHLRPVVHLHGHTSFGDDPAVSDLARVRTHQWLDTLAPLPPGLHGELADLKGLVRHGLHVGLGKLLDVPSAQSLLRQSRHAFLLLYCSCVLVLGNGWSSRPVVLVLGCLCVCCHPGLKVMPRP